MMDYTDALAAGWRIFPLHPITRDENGSRACGCGNPKCEAIGKHPKTANWQHSPVWDAEQLAYLEDEDGHFFGNQLIDGHGIVVSTSGLLVVDVDGRNGGWESAKQLAEIRAACGYIVQTGSQNGEHWYFKAPQGMALSGQVKHLPGIDFKSSGFVVGAFSLHASGHRYEALHGCPADVTDAPDSLVELLKRKASMSLSSADAPDQAQLAAMLQHITNDGNDYHAWVQIGMALHNATSGAQAGYELWAQWSRAGNPDEKDDLLSMKWHSFGKSANPVTAGTLYKMAQEGGYTPPVEFVDDTQWNDEVAPQSEASPAQQAPAKKASGADLLNPPGLVGQLTQWINSRCAFPRERLAVAAALQIVSNAAGLTHLVAGRDTSLNLITIGIAGSRTGKGAIKHCIDEAHQALGLLPAAHGKFKSSQELVRNAIQHQAIFYVYDEFGKQLEKLAGAARSGAHYLEDLLAEMIAMYSEANGVHGLSGDMKREMQADAERRIAVVAKRLGLEDGESPRDVAKREPDGELAKAYKALDAAQSGLVQPYLTFFGLSEPGSFTAALEKDTWLLTGGFLGRALIFEEEETVPVEKPPSSVSQDPMPAAVLTKLAALATAGHATAGKTERIERGGDWRRIVWAPDGEAFLVKVGAYWHEKAEFERDSGSGLESQALGAKELAIKVAGILAAGTGVITRVEMEWAHELIKAVTLDKIERARSSEQLTSRKPSERGDGLLSGIMRFMSKLEAGEHTTAGRVRNAVGRSKVSAEDVEKAIEHLCSQGAIKAQTITGKNGRSFTHLYKS